MIKKVKSLIVFCEGPHDIAYVRMVMKNIMDFVVVDLKFSEMPSPFHKLFGTAVKNHAAQDMALDMAHKFFLPDTVLRKENSIVFLFNCGGGGQYQKIRTLLSDYIPALKQAATFPDGAQEITESVRYVFLYDADSNGLEAIIKNINREFEYIDGISFVENDWQSSKSIFGKMSKDKAVFVWGDSPDRGTLEDILLPIFNMENKALVDKAQNAINEMFKWDIDNHDSSRAVAEVGKYRKAVMTVVGQRKKPGLSLNVIFEQSKLVSQKALQSCNKTQGFAEFISDFFEV